MSALKPVATSFTEAGDAGAFADFMAFGFRASDDVHEPGLLDVVGGFVLGALSRSERDAVCMDREKPKACAAIMRAQAGRFPRVPIGRPGAEVAAVGKAFEALAQLYDLRVRVRRAGPDAFDAKEAARLRRIAFVALHTAAEERARAQKT